MLLFIDTMDLECMHTVVWLLGTGTHIKLVPYHYCCNKNFKICFLFLTFGRCTVQELSSNFVA